MRNSNAGICSDFSTGVILASSSGLGSLFTRSDDSPLLFFPQSLLRSHRGARAVSRGKQTWSGELPGGKRTRFPLDTVLKAPFSFAASHCQSGKTLGV